MKTLHAEGDRIFVGDLQESFHYMRYKKADNALYVYADDIVPRHLTSALPLDYDTVAGADKFGNFVVTRLPAAVSAQVTRVVICCDCLTRSLWQDRHDAQRNHCKLAKESTGVTGSRG